MAGFTLGDLLALDLGLTLKVGDDDALRRPVAGAHSSELERPGAWVDRDWIVLTTGLRLHRRAAAQRALVGDLVDAGAAAIGFGVGIVYEGVPSALADEARRRGLPVLVVPLETPFRDVVGAIHRAQADTDALELQRLSAMQLQLMQAVGEAEPRAAVVARLAEMLQATVLLFSAEGTLVAHAGDEPAAGVWEAIDRSRGPLTETRAMGRHVVAVPVAAGLRPTGWLAVVSRRSRPAGRLTRPAKRSAAPLLAALSRIDAAAARQERAVRRSLLVDLIEQPDGRGRELAARAAELGVDLADRLHVVMLTPGATTTASEIVAAWEAALGRSGVPHLSAEYGDREVVSLVPAGSAQVRAAVAAVTESTGCTAGLGRPVAGQVDGVRRSLGDARLAARSAVRGGGATAIVAFSDLDLCSVAASSAPEAETARMAQALLAPLHDHQHLYDTLVTWFAHDCDVGATARALGLRSNSVRYRLTRIEAVLRRPLRSPRTIASLHVALMLEARAEPAADG